MLPWVRAKEYEVADINGADKARDETRLVVINPPTIEGLNIKSAEPSEYSLDLPMA